MLLSQCVDYYINSLKARRLSPKTVTNYQHNLNLFLKRGDKHLNKILKTDITNFLATRAELKAWTAHQSYRVMSSFFNYCKKEGFLEDSPWKNMTAPKLDDIIPETYAQEEIKKMMDACNEKRFIGARNRAIIAILLDTGIRADELVKLKLNDVDFRSGIVKVNGKGSKMRIVKYSEKTRRHISKYMMLQELRAKCDSVFLSEEGRPLTGSGLLTIISRLGESVGVKAYIHKFRHTCAIEYLRSGGNLKTLSVMLGHEEVSTTADLYLKALNSDDVINAHDKFSPGDKFL